MKKTIVLTVLMITGGCQHMETVPKLVLVQNGQSEYAIVQSAQPTEAEAFAVMELAEFIKRSTGMVLPIVTEKSFNGSRGVYVGQTAFACKHGVDFTGMGAEEWIIRTVDGNLIISGGRPRGTLYGVYEFLEKFIGIRFLDADTDFVPKRKGLTIPTNVSVREKPVFFRREILMVTQQPKQVLFQVRHKINAFANAAVPADSKYGYSIRFGSPYSTHTHPYYASAFPTNRPDYCAMRENGTRIAPPPPDCKGHWDGQVCMSHPEVRKFFTAKLREYIKQDREKIVKAGTGEPFPVLYALIPADNVNKCVCTNCTAIAKKYGAYSGLVLEFVNDIAENIAADYPEIRLTIGAYTFYADAPTGIRPRDNVVVYIAQLGAEFNTIPKRDTLRSMEHPLNTKAREMWEDWSKISKTLGVHDYWTAWSQQHQWPHANIHGLAQTLRFYHRCGLTHFFVEDELFGSRIHNFVDLRFYVATKLFQDPGQNEQLIIDEFMSLYYGKAAPVMRKLLNYIEKRQEEEPGILVTVPSSSRKYFKVNFFTETDAMLREAEKLAADDPKMLANVRQERLAFDETLLYLWNQLNNKRSLPFKRDDILARLQQNYEAAYKKYGGWGMAMKKGDDERLAYLRNMPSIPSQFEGKKIVDVANPHLNGGGQARRVDDPDAAIGKAWRLDASMTGSEGQHDQLPKFGLFQENPRILVTQVIDREKIPKDEKYHFYLVGRMKGSPNIYFWAHRSWRLAQRLFMSYDSSLPDQKTYDVYASIKLEGPSYVPGSSKTNAFLIDRLILVEVEDIVK
jgi:hypothetical protein